MTDLRRIVIARRWTGLGDCILSLLAAHRYAKSTGRDLVVDWRHSSYAPPDRNLFPLVFACPATWDGVALSTFDPAVVRGLDGPSWPPGWSADDLVAPAPTGERGDGEAAIALIAAGRDVDAPIVVFDGCIAPAAPAFDVCRRRLAALAPHDDVLDAVRGFADARFAGRPVIGLHVRHGNGGNIMGHARYWTYPGRALVRIADAARACADHLRARDGTEACVFLATDSGAVQSTLGKLLLGLVTRPKAFRTEGAGELHGWPHAGAGLHDAMVEMLLLAHVDLLLRFPPGSYFSAWGAIMKRPAPAGRQALATATGMEIA